MPPKKDSKKDPKKEVVEQPVIQQPVIPAHQLSGIGKFQYSKGAVYQGQWHLFKGIKMKHGKGTLTIPAQGSNTLGMEKYEGNWEQDSMSGEGTYLYANGAIYKGIFKNNLHHGEGKYEFPNATIYQGEWQNGLMHGTGSYIDSSGRHWHGEFRQGRFQTKLQTQLGQEKLSQVKKDTIKRQIATTLNNILQALAKSDKKTLKDNMAPFLVTGQTMKEFVKEPYSKIDERPIEKWTEVINILKTGKVKVLADRAESQILGSDRILGQQLKGAGQVIQIVMLKDQRIIKCAMATPDATTWNIINLQDQEKKK